MSEDVQESGATTDLTGMEKTDALDDDGHRLGRAGCVTAVHRVCANRRAALLVSGRGETGRAGPDNVCAGHNRIRRDVARLEELAAAVPRRVRREKYTIHCQRAA